MAIKLTLIDILRSNLGRQLLDQPLYYIYIYIYMLYIALAISGHINSLTIRYNIMRTHHIVFFFFKY